MATVAVSGTPQADTATSTGAVERILTVSGTPQAVTATSTGVVELGTKRASGTPQAETATSSGVADIGTKRASGTPQSETATSSGVVSVSAVFGEYDKTCLIKPETFGCIVKAETFGCIVPVCNIPTSSVSADVDMLITVSGSPQAETATSTGVVNIAGSTTVSGSPQAETATSSGVADSGAAQGAFVWLHPGTIVESSPGVPSTWDNDPSAGGGATYDMVIGTPVLPLTTGTRSGRTAIISAGQAGGGGFMSSSPPIADFAAPYTIFFVGGFDVVANAAGLFDAEQSLTNRVSMEAGTFPNSEIKLASVGVIASLARDNSPHVWAIRVDSTNHRARISGGAWQTSASATTNSYDYGTVLTNINSGLNAAGWAGEVIVFTSALTDADMDWRFNKLKLDWSIP
jgi:hypothetical protein